MKFVTKQIALFELFKLNQLLIGLFRLKSFFLTLIIFLI